MLITFRFTIFIFLLIVLVSAVSAQTSETERILIEGANAELAANIRNHLVISAESCDTPLSRLNRLAPQVRTNIRNAINALGYYRSTFELSFSVLEKCWFLHIDMLPGEQVQVDNVSVYISASEEEQVLFQKFIDELPDMEQAALHHGKYEEIKSTLSARAIENGYFSARFLRSEVVVDMSAYKADILIDFEPGPRFSFGEINIEPIPGFSRALIKSLVILQSGEPYSSERLLEQRTNFDESRYFNLINVSPQLSRVNQGAVPINISLVPRPRNAWSTGVGFTTDTGPRVRATYENRYINTRGHHIDSDLGLSPIRSQVNMAYIIPLSDPVRESLSFGTGFVTENAETYDSDRFKLELAYRRQSTSGWLETYSIDYLQDNYTVDLQQDNVTLTMPGYTLSKTVADDLIFPSRGWKLFGQIRGASDSMISDTTFLQVYGSGKGILSFGPGRFISKFEIGSTWIDVPAELPASVRFFTGGDQKLRGYQYNSLGPLNENNEVIGGTHLLTGSLEYDFPIKNNWRSAFFVDGGNAFSDSEVDWKQSIGMGLRWLSPIGPIRLDLAHAMSDEGGFRLHITMGPDL